MHRKYKKNGKWVEGSVTVKGKIKPLVQLTPRELDKLQKINYEQVETTFPSLEDYFA
jgi:hypothetical protein